MVRAGEWGTCKSFPRPSVKAPPVSQQSLRGAAFALNFKGNIAPSVGHKGNYSIVLVYTSISDASTFHPRGSPQLV